MSYTIKFLPEARQDVGQIIDWYNEQEAGLGARFLGNLAAALKLLSATPSDFPGPLQTNPAGAGQGFSHPDPLPGGRKGQKGSRPGRAARRPRSADMEKQVVTHFFLLIDPRDSIEKKPGR